MSIVEKSAQPAQAPPLSLSTRVKFLTEDWRGEYSHFDYTPYLPRNGRPGHWLPQVRGDLVLCHRGYHATTLANWREWRSARCAIWEFAPPEGRLHVPREDDTKAVGDGGRLASIVMSWNARNLRLFAADCAEHVLHLFERRHPDDTRPREAIAVARRFARGDAAADELRVAYERAAEAAAAAYAAYAAEAAAEAEAEAEAAGAAHAAYAAGAAAGAAAEAERSWQDARLLAYLNGTVEESR
jgi:hypothetical protein